MKKFSGEIIVLVCMTTFDSYGSSSESDDNLDSNKSGSASSLCSAMEESHLIVASLYESRIKHICQLLNKKCSKN